MKKAQRQEKVEWYLDCPYCKILVSDDDPNNGYDVDLTDGAIVECPNCKKLFKVTIQEVTL